MSKLIAFILFLLPVSDLSAQAADQSALLWNPFYRLTWYDFQGAPPADSNSDAGASVKITTTPFMVKNKVHYEVAAAFNRNKSWVRDQSTSLLAHEQIHFDIAEVYARKIRKKIEDLNEKGVSDVKSYNAAIRDLLAESNRADRQYDVETLHGALSRQQAAWSDKVRRELEALEPYRKIRRRIGS